MWQRDVTAQFAQSIRTSLRAMSASADALIEVLGSDDFAERVKRRESTLQGIDRGVLTRQIFAARAAMA